MIVGGADEREAHARGSWGYVDRLLSYKRRHRRCRHRASTATGEELCQHRHIKTCGSRDRRRRGRLLGVLCHVRLDLPQRREVEHQRLRELDAIPKPCGEPVAELNRTERVEPRLHQWRVRRCTWQQLCSHISHRRCRVNAACSHRRCRHRASTATGEELCQHRHIKTCGSRDRRRRGRLLGVLCHVRLDLPQRREVEHQRLRELDAIPKPCGEPVAELNRTERVEPRLHQWRVRRCTWQQLCSHILHRRCRVDAACSHRRGASLRSPSPRIV